MALAASATDSAVQSNRLSVGRWGGVVGLCDIDLLLQWGSRWQPLQGREFDSDRGGCGGPGQQVAGNPYATTHHKDHEGNDEDEPARHGGCLMLNLSGQYFCGFHRISLVASSQ